MIEGIQVPFCVTVKKSGIDLNALANLGVTIKIGTGTSPKFDVSVAPALTKLLPFSLIESAIKSKTTQTCSTCSGVRLKPNVDTSSFLTAQDIDKPEYDTCRLFKVPYVTFKSPLLEDYNRLGGSIFDREFNYRDNTDQWVLLSVPIFALVSDFVTYYDTWSDLLKMCGIDPATIFTGKQLLNLSLGLFCDVLKMPDTYGLVLAAYQCAGILPPNYCKIAPSIEFGMMASHLEKLNDLTKYYNEDKLLEMVFSLNKKFNEKYKEVFESFSISYSLLEGDICSSTTEGILKMVPKIIDTAFSFASYEFDGNSCLIEKRFSLAQIAQLHAHLKASSHVFLFTDETAPEPSKSYWRLKNGVSKTDFYRSFVSGLEGKNYEIINVEKKDGSRSRSSREPVQSLVVEIKPNTSFCENTVDSMYCRCHGRDGASHPQANAIRLVFAISSDESDGNPFSRINVTTVYPILASQAVLSSSSSSSGSSSSKP